MVAIATSSFSQMTPQQGTPVRITLYAPRYALKYPLRHRLDDLAPDKAWFKASDEVFAIRYVQKLEAIGAQTIEASFRSLATFADAGTDDNPLVMCCFENLAKPDNWCHRQLFAAWWERTTGQVVPELTGLGHPSSMPPFGLLGWNL